MPHKTKLILLDDVDPSGLVADDFIRFNGTKFVRYASNLLLPASLLTTKGDLITRTSSTVVRQGIGSDGAFFISDSAQPNGLKWLLKLLATQDVAFSGILSPSQITADQNDYNPTNLAMNTILRINSDAARNITGLQGGAAGRIIILLNVGSFSITLKNASASSSAANRFALNADYVLKTGGGCALVYDATASRWVVWAQSDVGSGGSSLTIQEVDGTPSGTPSTLEFPNGTLTDHGGGVYEYVPAGGGSGASTSDHFIVGQGGEADTDLSNKVVIPRLSADPDIRVAGTNDAEFDSSSTTGWSSFSTGITFDFNTTAKSMAYLKRTNQSGDTVGGIIRAVGASIPYTVTAHLVDFDARTANVWPLLFVSDSSTGAGKAVAVGPYGGFIRDATFTTMTTFAGFGSAGTIGFGSAGWFLRLVVHAANNIDVLYSYNGYVWGTYATAINLLATAGYIGFGIDAFNADVQTVWDWIRLT